MPKLDSALTKRFKTIGHTLKPIVTISNKGLNDNIFAEINRALEDHELIKIKVAIPDRVVRANIISDIVEASQATTIDTIGKVLLCYRPAKKPNHKLSNILRYTNIKLN